MHVFRADVAAKRFPDDTIVKFNYLPSIHAQLAVSHNDAAKAIEVLRDISPYEGGQVREAPLSWPHCIPSTCVRKLRRPLLYH